jgi:hypothetical protein
MECAHQATLTATDRNTIERARTVAALRGEHLRRHAAERDPALAMAACLGEAQHLLGELAALAERLGGAS